MTNSIPSYCNLLSFILILLLAGYNTSAQDTTVSKRILDSLRWKVNHLKEVNKYQEFKTRLLTELNKIDTIHKSNDSVVIAYKTANGQFLRKQTEIFDSINCMTDSIISYYNNQGLAEFIENWEFACGGAGDNLPGGKPFGYRSSYQRYEYDNLGRVTLHVFKISTPMVRRRIYHYDKNGKQSIEDKTINENEFWE